MVAPLVVAALGLTGLTGLLVVTRKPRAPMRPQLPIDLSPGARVNVGNEVAFPVSAIPGLQAPPNAGGVIMVVDSVTPTTLRGPIVAFVGPGGTADLAVPIGPLELPRSAVSAITQAPTDRVGRFAQPGDDVFLPPTSLPEGAKAAFLASPDSALFLAPGTFVQVRLKQLDASGAVAGDITGILAPPRGSPVRPIAPIPTSFFPRVGILRVVRNGSLIFEKRELPVPGFPAPRVGAVAAAAPIGELIAQAIARGLTPVQAVVEAQAELGRRAAQDAMYPRRLNTSPQVARTPIAIYAHDKIREARRFWREAVATGDPETAERAQQGWEHGLTLRPIATVPAGSAVTLTGRSMPDQEDLFEIETPAFVAYARTIDLERAGVEALLPITLADGSTASPRDLTRGRLF